MADTTGSGSSVGTAATAAAAAAAVVGGFAAYQAVTNSDANWSSAFEAARLLNQATFGARRHEIDAIIEEVGINGWIDGQRSDERLSVLAYNLVLTVQDGLMAAALAKADAGKAAGTLDDVAYAAAVKDAKGRNFIGPNQIQRVIIWLMMNGEDQLRQRMAFALSQIFVVSFNGISNGSFFIARYYDILRQNAFGNFRDLLKQVTLSSAMGLYLNMSGNFDRKNGTKPDENYAREVMQLMTIGLEMLNLDGTTKTDSNGLAIPSYSQADVSGLAAVFTGWQVAGGRGPGFMQAYPQYHSLGEKTFLGTTLPALTVTKPTTAQLQAYQNAELETALDVIFNHPNVGPFIALRLIQRLTVSNPSPDYVTRVASAFNNNGLGVRGDLWAVVCAVLKDVEARPQTPGNFTGKLREPLLRYTHLLRSLEAIGDDKVPSGDSPGQTDVSAYLYTPFTAPTVFNFWSPFYSPPNSVLFRNGMRAPEMQEVYTSSTVNYVNYMLACVNRGGITAQLEHKIDYGTLSDVLSDPASGKLDIEGVITHLDLLLCGGYLSAPLKDTIRATLSNIVPASAKPSVDDLRDVRVVQIKAAVGLIMLSLDYLVQL